MQAGHRLGSFEILEPLGSGGMGSVYRARDVDLGRTVALKILRPDLAHDEQLVARLHREARLLAALEHPRIARLYSFDESGGQRFLSMELIDGETLADRLQRGPLSVEEAVRVCGQIAEGLDAAHLAGIVHRDLKPANVLLDQDGDVHLADFGIARSFETAPDAATSALTSGDELTGRGVQVGTVPYMSPEQIRGQPADARADVWALGCTFYEALAGAPAFGRETAADTTSAILGEEPDWTKLPAATPRHVRALLTRMLEKDPRRRQRSAGDVWLEMAGEEDQRPAGPEAGRARQTGSLGWIVAAALGALALALALWPEAEPPRPLRGRVSVALPRGLELGRTSTHNLALSPDGRHIAFRAFVDGVAPSRLFIQPTDQLEAVEVYGAGAIMTPIFSPDGRYLAFTGGRAGDLWKLALDGGEPELIWDDCESRGATWGDDGYIYFATVFTGLYRVPAAGGTPEQVVSMDVRDPEVDAVIRFPYFVRGRNALIFTADREGGRPDDGQVELLMLDDMSRRVLLDRAVDARPVASGHLVFSRSPNLMAVAFDLDRLLIVGDPVPLPEQPQTSWLNRGESHWAVSANGALAYEPEWPNEQYELVRVSRDGTITPLEAPTHAYSGVAASQDGSLLVLAIADARQWWLATYDVTRRSLQRIELEDDAYGPLLSRDARTLIYSTQHEGGHSLWVRTLDGAGQAQRIVRQSPYLYARGWLGENIAVATQVPPRPDVSLLAVDSTTGESRPLVDTDSDDTDGTLSPDGNWLAYTSAGNLFVQPYPSRSTPVQLTSDGSFADSRWSVTGRTLFVERSGAVDAIAVPTRPGEEFGKPERLFEIEVRGGRLGSRYAVIEGDEFVFIRATSPSPPNDRLVLVLDWFEQLRELAPAR